MSGSCQVREHDGAVTGYVVSSADRLSNRPWRHVLSLTYFSSTADILSKEQRDALVRNSRADNEDRGVTGMMLYTGSNFIQTIEGPDEAVDALFTLIDADPRHHDVFIVRREEIVTRRFTAWFMGYREISKSKAETIPGFIEYLQTGEIQGSTAQRHATLTSQRVFNESAA
jgi:Xaa-Pro aminopeptidase